MLAQLSNEGFGDVYHLRFIPITSFMSQWKNLEQKIEQRRKEEEKQQKDHQAMPKPKLPSLPSSLTNYKKPKF